MNRSGHRSRRGHRSGSPDSSTSMTVSTYPAWSDPRATSMNPPYAPPGAVSVGAGRHQLAQLLTSMPACPVGWYGSGSATPENRSAIQWTMSSIDTGITPAWLCPG